MAGFEEQLNSILGNQEAMSQIMALARSLSGEQGPAAETEGQAGAPAEETPYVPAAAEPPPPDLSAMLGQLDPKMLRLGMEVMRQVQSDGDRNTALLGALRPFLREERQARLERAIQIARMARAIRVSLSVLGGKEGECV